MDITSRNEIIKDLILEASDISSTLMSEGYMTENEWQDGIGTIGFFTNGRFDITKFNTFLNRLQEYDDQKYMLGTTNNLWIYLQKRGVRGVDGELIKGEILLSNRGNSFSIEEDINANNLVHIKRFVFHNGDIYILGVVVWR